MRWRWLLPLFVLVFASVAFAQVPRYINFQGRLADKALTPLTGTYSIEYSLWDTSAVGTGTACFTETLSVPVNSGLFNVLIGSGTSGGIGSCSFLAPYYLQIKISTDTTPMSPRLPLTAVPYALNADKLDGLDVDAFQQRDPATGNVIVTGKLGVGKVPVEKLDVDGYVRGSTGLCMGASCRTSWWSGTVSSMTAGTGISLSSNPITTTGTVNVNQSTVQKRVNGSCATNQGMQSIDANGNVTCLTVPAAVPCTYAGRTYSSGVSCKIGSSGSSPFYTYYYLTCQSNGSWSSWTSSSSSYSNC